MHLDSWIRNSNGNFSYPDVLPPSWILLQRGGCALLNALYNQCYRAGIENARIVGDDGALADVDATQGASDTAFQNRLNDRLVLAAEINDESVTPYLVTQAEKEYDRMDRLRKKNAVLVAYELKEDR